MHSEVIVWLVILVVCIAVEACTMGLATIWFAGGALVAAIIAYFGGNIWLQLMAFLIVSLLLVIFTRPVAVKYFNKDRAKTNVERWSRCLPPCSFGIRRRFSACSFFGSTW